MRASLVVSLLLALAGCEHGTCSRHSDCRVDEVCGAAGVCTGAPDAGSERPEDAMTLDPGDAAPDAELPDAELPDGGP